MNCVCRYAHDLFDWLRAHLTFRTSELHRWLKRLAMFIAGVEALQLVFPFQVPYLYRVAPSLAIRRGSRAAFFVVPFASSSCLLAAPAAFELAASRLSLTRALSTAELAAAGAVLPAAVARAARRARRAGHHGRERGACQQIRILSAECLSPPWNLPLPRA